MLKKIKIKFRFIITILLLFSSTISWGKIVNKVEAKEAAINFYKYIYHNKTGNSIDKLKISSSYSIKSNNMVVYYIFNFENHGYVQLSADDAAYPILAFDFYNQINTKETAPNYQNWEQKYIDQIDFIRKENLSATNEISNLWQSLLNNQNITIAQGKSINPLLLSTWNQGALYNADCPEDQNGPGGRVYAGCVAIAMAQIMYYYRYPYQGTGTKTYNHYLYGSMTANFGATTYDWNAMANAMPIGGNTEIAKLLYHLGISVEMDYSASGSGAYSGVAASSLQSYFKYSNNLSYDTKSDFTYNQWVDKIVANIDSGRPLYYDGYGNDGGHAFNLDGYQGSDHFHFNWGWGGAYNGYFYLNALNPGSSGFNNGQSAMFNVYPANSYPYYCNTNNQYTNIVGNFSDGSGPESYNNNSQCSWLIQPNQGIKNIKIKFDRFDIDNTDTLFVYDGSSNTDSLLAKLTGDQIPTSIFSIDNTMFLEFISDNTNSSTGFDISYESFFPIYCSGTALFTDSASYIEDGSDTSDYNNSTFCKWLIKPTNGYPIRLFFDSFNLEQGNDLLKIYDPSTTPSQLLATLTGNNIPPSIVSPGGEMFLTFTTNSSQTASGWQAHYITGPSVGISVTEKQVYKIYPNPAKSFVVIQAQSGNKITNIQLYSIEGKLIKSISNDINNSKIKLNLTNIQSGIYLLNIISNSSSNVQKIIIK
ncbi:MAG: hypothetical protein DRI86_10945 [Bacteroidetes bacterium]|nr:MAG: hypothetical protein DRI86_10945 [Bacteroidota bacterium]